MQRYRLRQGALREHPEGEWVRWEDVQAIAAKLPKCWRLNEAGELVQDCRVVPGMTAWYRENRHIVLRCEKVESVVLYADCVFVRFERCTFRVPSEVWDSREAAEAAKDTED